MAHRLEAVRCRRRTKQISTKIHKKLKADKNYSWSKIAKPCSLLKAKYCPRGMSVPQFVDPGQLCITGTQPSLAPPSECICSFWQTYRRLLYGSSLPGGYPHTKTCDLDPWPMTLILEIQQGSRGSRGTCLCKISQSQVQQFMSYHVNKDTEEKLSDNDENNTTITSTGSNYFHPWPISSIFCHSSILLLL